MYKRDKASAGLQADNRTFSPIFNIKKIAATALIGLMGIGMLSPGNTVTASAKTPAPFVVNDNWLEPAVIDDSETADITRRGAALPAKFDARKQGWITPVKDQGDYESCWAFASIAVIEANLIKNGRAPSSIDLSENQLAYFFYNRQTDKLGYTAGDYNTTLRGNYLSSGGTLQGTGIALTTWAGVTTEDKSPYLTTPPLSLCYASDYSVKNVYLYNYNTSPTDKLNQSVATIKQAVLDHGAVACGIFMDPQYLNYDNAAYNCTIKGGNHAVTIVGWDDNYSANKFLSKPSSNGAWIVKNSYGTELSALDNGYMYVSYEDKSITEFMSFEVITSAEQYNNNYQHDGSANPSYSYNGGDWYANVFKAKGAAGYNEELKAVGVYSLATTAKYEIQVYTGLTNAGKPTSGTKVFSSPVKGTLNDAGFQTIELPKAVSLTAGENFSVLVRLTTPSGKNSFIGVDSSYRNDWIAFIAYTGKNQSFAKIRGKWFDLSRELNANARIKAYTDITSVKSNFKLSSSNLGVSKGSTQKLSLNHAQNVYRTVTWKSSNSKIASVNSKGAVKGKTYGTTTISATFMAGAKKKTLKCKVTVGPPKVKNFKVSGGKKLKVKWKKSSGANGYEIYYSSSKDGKYKKLASI
ncbi:MAG: Ig-like domain-containing protein, partial [Lachnospiraceae bacterium]|nr:Ig-like domain-containing protein [Lachnospiraceae bacterium]